VEELLGSDILGSNHAPDLAGILVDQMLSRGTAALHIRMLAKDSNVYEQLTTRLPDSHCLYEMHGPDVRHGVLLPDSFEKYLSAQFDSKKRNDLKRKARLLSEHVNGAVTIRCFRAERDVADFMNVASPVAHSSWQAATGNGTLDDSEERLNEYKALARAGMWRAYTLHANGGAVAFVVGPEYRGVLHYDIPAFDPHFGRFSPGVILVYRMIEDLCNNHSGMCQISFGFGDNPYKRTFANVTIPVAECLVYPRALPYGVRIALHKSFRHAVRFGLSLARTLRRAAHRLRGIQSSERH
jgi:CelD/BcsL family acetyltransferase involved in cellulose biosynthesis